MVVDRLAAVGGVLVLVGLVTVSEYGVAAGVILAAIWGPILGVVASALTWGIRAVVLRFATSSTLRSAPMPGVRESPRQAQ